MSEQENVQAVIRIYEAFGKGDVKTILSMVAEKVHWESFGPEGSYPWVGVRTNHVQVAEFFSAIAESLEVLGFEPKEFISNNDTVVVLGNITGRGRATGKVGTSEWAMVWKFEAGKVVRYYDYQDNITLSLITKSA